MGKGLYVLPKAVRLVRSTHSCFYFLPYLVLHSMKVHTAAVASVYEILGSWLLKRTGWTASCLAAQYTACRLFTVWSAWI